MIPVLIANAIWVSICAGFGVLFMIQARIDRGAGRNPGGDD
jgi:hypothetical protein